MLYTVKKKNFGNVTGKVLISDIKKTFLNTPARSVVADTCMAIPVS